MTETRNIDGHTYTPTTDGSYLDENGGEWVAFEITDVKSKIRWAGRELAKISREQILTEDGAALYTEIKEIEASAEEDLRIMELLFG